MQFGRSAQGSSLAARREAAQRRLSSSARQTELVDQAVRMLDERMAVLGWQDPSGLLHATARAMLAVAYDVKGYDVAFAPGGGHVAVRVQHTEFGLEVDLVTMADAVVPGADPGDGRLLE